MRIGYLILAHQHPHLVARLVRLIDRSGGVVAIHYDASAGDTQFQQLKTDLGDLAERVLWADRTTVAWGAWSIAEATLNGLEALARSDHRLDYVHLMSGADYPIRPLSEFATHLTRAAGTEFIEAVDIRHQKWVRIGPEHERYLYHHHFNWRSHPWLSQRYWRLQRRLRLKRRFPKGLSPHLGSQWWTLTWPTCQRILAAGRDPAIRRFFRTVAIPDEMFFQTIVAAHTPRHRIATAGLTFSQFTDYGVPVVYYDDHVDYLARQPFFFARKISPHATGLRDALDAATRGERALPALAAPRISIRGNEYDTVRLARREPDAGSRIIGHITDPDLGDMASARPFLALVGASREELTFLQQLIAASGAAVCHGDLFAADSISFLGNLDRYGGYRRDDMRLRDQSPTTFLADILRKSGRMPSGLVLPWSRDGGMIERLYRAKAIRPLIVRGNILRAFLEHRSVVTTAAETIAEGEFAGFLRTLKSFHDGLPKPPDGSTAIEISLMKADWLDQLNAGLARLATDCGTDTVARISPEFAVLAASRLSDPSERIGNAVDLVRTLPAHLRAAHLEALTMRQGQQSTLSPLRPAARPAPALHAEMAHPIAAAE